MEQQNPAGNLDIHQNERKSGKFLKVLLAVFIVLTVVLLGGYVFTLLYPSFSQREIDLSNDLGYQDFAADSPDSEREVDTFPGQYGFLFDRTWTVEIFQPVLKGFENTDGYGVLVLDVDGVEVRALVTGNIGDVSRNSISYQENISTRPRLVTFEELQNLLVIGDRVGLEIVTKFPEEVSDEEYCSNKLYLCETVYIAQGLDAVEATSALNFDLYNPEYLPVNQVHKEITKKIILEDTTDITIQPEEGSQP